MSTAANHPTTASPVISASSGSAGAAAEEVAEAAEAAVAAEVRIPVATLVAGPEGVHEVVSPEGHPFKKIN